MELGYPTDNLNKFGLDLENSVIRLSTLEQHVFNFVWKIQDIPKELHPHSYLFSPVFTDSATGNEWRLKLNGEAFHTHFCLMRIQLVRCGSGQIIQTALELNFLDSEMKTSLYNIKHFCNAHQPRGGNEEFFRTVPTRALCGENSRYLSSENSLIIHICLKTTHMHQNPTEISSLPPRKSGLLAQQLQNVWPNDKYSDVTLTSENGTRFPASKIILAANSPVFHTIFNSEMKEATENELMISGFSDDVLKGFLEFAYIGFGSRSGSEQTDDKCSKENAAELLKFAEAYDVKHLKEECERILIRNLTIDNAADMLYLTSYCNTPALKDQVIEFFKSYRNEVQNTPSFQKMKVENPQVLIEFYSELN